MLNYMVLVFILVTFLRERKSQWSGGRLCEETVPGLDCERGREESGQWGDWYGQRGRVWGIVGK